VKSVKVNGYRINNIGYEYDTVLLVDNITDIKKRGELYGVNYNESLDLYLNISKAKIMEIFLRESYSDNIR